MRRAIEHAAAGTWPHEDRRATVTLDYDSRSRRRIRLTDDGGGTFLLDLPAAVVLHEEDGLRLECGGWIAVATAPEPLAEVTCSDLRHLVRVAWHLGNRHLPTEIDGTTIYIRRDHVIEAMLQGLGARVRQVDRPFNPEGGAYGDHGVTHGHEHGHGHGHGHSRTAGSGHEHDHGLPGQHRHRHALARQPNTGNRSS